MYSVCAAGSTFVRMVSVVHCGSVMIYVQMEHTHSQPYPLPPIPLAPLTSTLDITGKVAP